jgi:hypothetical protein
VISQAGRGPQHDDLAEAVASASPVSVLVLPVRSSQVRLRDR